MSTSQHTQRAKALKASQAASAPAYPGMNPRARKGECPGEMSTINALPPYQPTALNVASYRGRILMAILSGTYS
ncbi:hypothetical protein MAPG_10233 [Magnaporthiopsis poae ATCC 64411]|uniref:Uncharacterized protein n=1 Tax=Magnaporthiopsis poae (strain ATCC 64411 / 73-15) TaxID=644358 RepID=A0A0C4EC20_MAGP6|nr:hypothetical protein MAPG_10233 [Magnaporthiopsis poae ATCC 64411]